MHESFQSGEYPKTDAHVKIKQEVAGLRFMIQDCVGEIIHDPKLDPDAKIALETFARTNTMEILYAPIREGGPKLVTALEHIGKAGVWNELHKYGFQIALRRPSSVVLPAKGKDQTEKRAANG